MKWFCCFFFLLTSCGELRHSEFRVSGNCDMCKENIEKSLQVNGVKFSRWNVDTKMLEVNYDEKLISLGQIRQKIACSGYDSDSLRASDIAYSRLHECCRYRD